MSTLSIVAGTTVQPAVWERKLFRDLVVPYAGIGRYDDVSRLTHIVIATSMKQKEILEKYKWDARLLCTTGQITRCINEQIAGGVKRLTTDKDCYNGFPVMGRDGPTLAIVYLHATFKNWQETAWNPSDDRLILPAGSRLFLNGSS